jgi:hypothetical protein
MFDYATIPDVILQISYTALDDGAFRTTIETAMVDDLTSYAASAGMFRLFSLRHDFPDSFYQFLNPGTGAQATRIVLGTEHFPYFLSRQNLSAAGGSIYLQPKATSLVDTSDLAISLNGKQSVAWSTLTGTSVSSADIPMNGPVRAVWAVKVTAGHLDPEAVSDVLLLVKYTVS